MAKRAKGVTEQLLAAAKQEFLEKGYEDASLRNIAKRANSSKGAIYIRYADKAALYRAVVEPATKTYCENLKKALSVFMALPAEGQRENINSYSSQGIDFMIDGIYRDYELFKILVSSGETAVYNEFLHALVEIDNACTSHFIEVTENDAFTSGRLTHDLMHMISNAFYAGVFEIVVHDMPKEEAVNHLIRLRVFYNAGWQTILQPHSSQEGRDP